MHAVAALEDAFVTNAFHVFDVTEVSHDDAVAFARNCDHAPVTRPEVLPDLTLAPQQDVSPLTVHK